MGRQAYEDAIFNQVGDCTPEERFLIRTNFQAGYSVEITLRHISNCRATKISAAEAFEHGEKTAKEGGFRVIPAELGIKIMTPQQKAWYAGYDNAEIPARMKRMRRESALAGRACRMMNDAQG